MDQIVDVSGNEQPPPEISEGRRIVRLLFDAMGKDPSPAAAWHLQKFMKETSVSGFCRGWITTRAMVQPKI